MANKPSLYASYLTEKTNHYIIETDYGFITYQYLNEGKTVYIMDIYIEPRSRELNLASSLADTVALKAKSKGCTEMLGTVQPSSKNSTFNLKVLLGYGMTLQSSTNDLVVFTKDIK